MGGWELASVTVYPQSSLTTTRWSALYHGLLYNTEGPWLYHAASVRRV